MNTHSDNSFNVLERLNQLLLLHDNMSVYQLAKQSGIARATIQGWFDKNNYPPIDKLETICHVLNITLAEFFYEGKDTGTDGEMITLEDNLLIKQYHKLPPQKRKLVTELVDALLEDNA